MTLLWEVLNGSTVRPPPIWLMRQAGRYLPEYREIRAQAGSFLDLCYDPRLATEITLQPVRRFDLDAAIVFSDILVVPHAMGREVWFVTGEGPRLDPMVEADIDRLDGEGLVDRLSPVMTTLAAVRKELAPGKSLIGFCGAPWTVATYMIAGRGTADQAPARVFAETNRDGFVELIRRLVEASADYLIAQARAGADVLQIFDSWAGVLGEQAFVAWCVEPVREIVARVRAAEPDVAIIGFPKGAGILLDRYVDRTGVDGLAIDWTVPLAFARTVLQPLVAVQGNLDPLTLVNGGRPLVESVTAILDGLSPGRFIFNLGHGIRPETPVGHVEELVAMVRDWRGGNGNG